MQISLITITVMYLILIPLTASYLRMKDRDKTSAVVVKGLCTFSILLAAVAGLTLRGVGAPDFDSLIIIGLAFGLVGDVVIGYSFIAGGAFFALGHFSYIAALLIRTDNLPAALPVWAAFFLAAIFAYKKSGLKAGKIEIPAMFYAAVILYMVSLAVTVPVMLPAAVLFAASDAMLGAYLMGGKKNRRLDMVSLWCYFIGQSLFAVAVILPRYV